MSAPWLQLYDKGLGGELAIEHENALAMFKASVARAPDKDLLRYFDTPLSLRLVDELSDALAVALAAEGIGRGDRVALYLQNVPQFPIALLAAWKLGALAVPCNPMLRARELGLVLRDSGAKALIALESLYAEAATAVLPETDVRLAISTSELDFLDEVPAVLSGSHRERPEGTHDLLELVAQHQRAKPNEIALAADDIALLMYTSGTTGPPKGAMNTHRNVVFTAQAFRDWVHLDENDVVLGIAPLFHITGMIVNLAVSCCAGVPSVLAYRFDPAETCRLIERYRTTFTCAAITAYLAMANCDESGTCDLTSMTKAYAGGAPVPPAAVENFERRTGVVIRTAYGLTETTAPSHLTPLGQRPPVDDETGALACGVPIFNTGFRILDDAGRPVAAGEQGEVALTGPQVFAGYWANPDETDRVLRDGELLTGDIAKADELGWLYIVDRKKDLIVASGYKVWPREVEEVLYSHPSVREAAVIGVPDSYRGETVHAFVSANTGQQIDEEELNALCRRELAAYKRPRLITVLDELPKSPAGKILRRKLRETAASPA